MSRIMTLSSSSSNVWGPLLRRPGLLQQQQQRYVSACSRMQMVTKRQKNGEFWGVWNPPSILRPRCRIHNHNNKYTSFRTITSSLGRRTSSSSSQNDNNNNNNNNNNRRMIMTTSTTSIFHNQNDCRRRMVFRMFSSTPTTMDDHNNNSKLADRTRAQLGLGSHKWTQLMKSPKNTNTKTDSSETATTTTTTTTPKTTVYQEIVETALANGITTLEVGQEGGDAVLSSILWSTSSATTKENHPHNDVTLLKRVGYRTVVPPSTKKDNDTTATSSSLSTSKLLPGDIMIEEVPVPSPPPPPPTNEHDKDNSDKPMEEGKEPTSPPKKKTTTTMGTVVHNLSPESIRAAMQESPWFQPSNENDDNDNAEQRRFGGKMTVLLHNPEVQATQDSGGGGAQALSYDQRQERIRHALVQAFTALEQEIRRTNQNQNNDNDNQSPVVASYGIVSNGLALAPSHPMHLSWRHAIQPALDETRQHLNVDRLHFSVLQLPLNVWETQGVAVARQVKEEYQDAIQIYAMRPLTAYPTPGGDETEEKTKNDQKDPNQSPSSSSKDDSPSTPALGYPMILADYRFPAGGGGKITTTKTANDSDNDEHNDSESPQKYLWSNAMQSPPEIYQTTWQQALQHFDAHDILQHQAEGNELTTEQRETLDGCKLLQSLFHDVDVGLQSVLSWEQHETFLYKQIIPLIHDTFEGYDDETAQVLQRFFAAYSLAVRYSIAQNTRRFLCQQLPIVPVKKDKENDNNDDNEEEAKKASTVEGKMTKDGVYYPPLPDDMKLQDYAIRFLLEQRYTITNPPSSSSDSSSTKTDESKADDDPPADYHTQESVIVSPPTTPPTTDQNTAHHPLVDKLIVDFTEPDHVLYDLEVVHQYFLEQQQQQQQQRKKESHSNPKT